MKENLCRSDKKNLYTWSFFDVRVCSLCTTNNYVNGFRVCYNGGGLLFRTLHSHLEDDRTVTAKTNFTGFSLTRNKTRLGFNLKNHKLIQLS